MNIPDEAVQAAATMANELKGQILVDALCKGEAFLDNDLKPHWNTRTAAKVEVLERYDISMFGNGAVEMGGGEYVRFDQAEAIIAALKKDRLPDGHTVLEQADMHDGTGRISQTVRVEATGEEYERIVHADEAYGEDE